MKLKNANPNGCNVEIKNVHPMIFIFKKISKIESNKGLQSLL